MFCSKSIVFVNNLWHYCIKAGDRSINKSQKRENMTTKRQKSQAKPETIEPQSTKPRCGLCGKTRKLTKTECCGQWICDDEDKYVLFSYANNSCSRNHRRYTLCSFHYNEEHSGRWQDCKQCRKSIEPEMYVWFGTNEYNFEKLTNPPAYKPTKCAKCKKVISLSEDGYLIKNGKYICEGCSDIKFP